MSQRGTVHLTKNQQAVCMRSLLSFKSKHLSIVPSCDEIDFIAEKVTFFA